MSTSTGATDTGRVGRSCYIRGVGLSKTFGHVRALQDVDVEVNTGEVLAIVGDNGAGKSTLIKILGGVYQPDSGRLEVGGLSVNIPDPRHAHALGIAIMFQDLALVNDRDVASNVFLGYEPTRFRFFVDKARMSEMTQAVLTQLRIDIPSLSEEVGNMSGGQRQAIAIGRALSHKSQIVIMDEPTAALGVKESRQVLDVIRWLKEEGVGVVVISHNLLHVFNVADRIMVLRHGRKVGVRNKQETSPDEIVKMIVGVEIL